MVIGFQTRLHFTSSIIIRFSISRCQDAAKPSAHVGQYSVFLYIYSNFNKYLYCVSDIRSSGMVEDVGMPHNG